MKIQNLVPKMSGASKDPRKCQIQETKNTKCKKYRKIKENTEPSAIDED